MSGQALNLHDADNFAQLFEQTHLSVFRYIYGLYGGPRDEVEDLTAETFTRAWKARNRFMGDENAALRWLLQIARNLVIDRVDDLKFEASIKVWKISVQIFNWPRKS